MSDLDRATWDDTVLNGLQYLNKSVLQVPFLLMTLMRYVTPTLDEMYVSQLVYVDAFSDRDRFMESLKWVDDTYTQKHKAEDPRTLRAMYYPTLVQYSTKGSEGVSRSVPTSLMLFARRYGRKVAMLFGVYLLSLLPVVGRLVMPAVSFFTFEKNVGTTPAAVIFGTGILLPKRFLVTFLHTYFASRSLMRELVRSHLVQSGKANANYL